MIEDKIKKIECNGEVEKKISDSEKDFDDKSSSYPQDLKGQYLTRCLRVLDLLKEMLIHAGVPIINSGMNINQRGFEKMYTLNEFHNKKWNNKNFHVFVEIHTSANNSPPTYELSSSDKDTIVKILQGIVILGIIPNLFLGVGLPIQKRKKIYQIFQENVAVDEVGIDDKMSLKKTKQEKLSFVMTHLLNLLNLEVFSSVILTKHLGDLLAGLIQTVFSPIVIMVEDTDVEV